MPQSSLSAASALVMFLSLTAAVLGLTFSWAWVNHRPLRVYRHLLGRPAVPYWHSPTGLADERGITARLGGTPQLWATRRSARGADR